MSLKYYIIVGLFLIFGATTTNANELIITVDRFSQHFAGHGDKNQSHHARGVEYNNISVMTFINSYNDRVWCVEKVNRNYISINNKISFGYRYGICDGYKFGDYNKPFPIILPTFTYDSGTFLTEVACTWEVCAIDFRIRWE